uniref:Zf-CCHC domain-containing protein/UBN2 domain-containing protein n=1 Tax=Tanacetum cinerariifolium TaxID=118510 RepID=A0A699HWY4_TANCI|nr:zf-CCHC domain-containing protein/UBN2 domain-containing protein [Tanacetum cinerariifolium]
MDSKNYKEGQSMQRPPLFEDNCFIYWENSFKTYVKSKDIDLWHIIVYGDYKPTIKNKDTGKEEVIPYEKFEEIHIKMISNNDEAKMVLYNALPKKEYKRIFMCKTAKDVWNSLIITHKEASKNTKEKYKSLALKAKKVSSVEEVSCSSSDEEYAMAVRDFKKFFRRRGKFIRQPYDDKKNLERAKEEKKGKEERRCFKCSDPNHFISGYPKHSFNDQKAFVRGCWSDREEEDDSMKNEICLMALDNNEVLSNTLYYSSSSLDSKSLQNEYNTLCKINLRIINKNKLLKTKNEILDNEVCNLKKKLECLEKSKEISVECESTQKDKKGLGFTENRASTSEAKTEKLDQESGKLSIVEPTELVLSTREPVRLKVKLEPNEWIKDSGCSRHMTGNKDLFSTYEAINGGNVVFGSNTKSKIIGKGQTCDKKCKVLFNETGSEILKDGITIGTRIKRNGLCVMKMGNSPKDSLCLAVMDDTSTLWHIRLGHANM